MPKEQPRESSTASTHAKNGASETPGRQAGNIFYAQPEAAESSHACVWGNMMLKPLDRAKA